MRRRLVFWTAFGLVSLGGWWAAFRYLTRFHTLDVLFVPTPHDVVARMLELAELRAGDVVYDLGCGDGRIPIAAARAANVRAVGYEIDPELVEQARLEVRLAGLQDRVRIERRDIFELDLRGATVITLYLMPHLNQRLLPRLEHLPPGVRILSHEFSMKGARPRLVEEMQSAVDGQVHLIYLWITPLDRED